jgi:ribosomal protein S18 acetylase RimI-like enzyme
MENGLSYRMSGVRKSDVMRVLDSLTCKERLYINRGSIFSKPVIRCGVFFGGKCVAFLELGNWLGIYLQANIAVSPEHRGMGIARELCRIAQEFLFSSAYQAIAWTCHKRNKESVGLAVAMGYVKHKACEIPASASMVLFLLENKNKAI